MRILKISIFCALNLMVIMGFTQTDQSLVYASFFGGIGWDRPSNNPLATHTDGTWAMVGFTGSFNLWTSPDAYQSNLNGFTNAFITKFDIDGNPTFSSYLGGGGESNNLAIDFNTDGGLVVVGTTEADEFPVTDGAHLENFSGFRMGFISVFSPVNDLIWSTFVGGSENDACIDVVVGSSGDIFVSGVTISPDLGTPGTFQENLVNSEYGAAFVARFSSSGEQLWFSYVQGNDHTFSRNIAVSPDGTKLYVLGNTPSTEGLTLNAFQENNGGSSDLFLTCFSVEDGSALWSTFYGGEGYEIPGGMAISNNGNVVISGYTESENNIASEGAFQETFGGGWSDQFLVCFSPAGERLWSTYFGGEGEESGNGLSVSDNQILITGFTTSSTGITFGNPMEPTFGTNNDPSYIAGFDLNSGDLIWSTYFMTDVNCAFFGRIAHLNGSSKFVIAGSAFQSCPDVLTPGAFQNFYGGGDYDVIYAIFDEHPLSVSNTLMNPLNIYPNPARDKVFVELPDKTSGNLSLQVFDMSGRLVAAQSNFSSGSDLDISALPPAVYMVTGTTAEASFRQKLVVTK